MGYTPEFKKLYAEMNELGENVAEVFYARLQELGQLQRCLNLYRIEDKKSGEYIFFGDVISDEQKYLIENQTGRDLILKPRQIGMTGLQIILAVDEAIFIPGTRAGIMAHTKDKAISSIFERVRKTLEWFIKDWGELVPIELAEDSKQAVSIKNKNSSVIVGYDFRSNKLTKLHVSESAFVREDVRITASQQAVPDPPFGRVSHETTPRGRAGWFFDNWMTSRETEEKGRQAVWKRHFFKWWEHYPEKGRTFDAKGVRWDERELELKTVYGVGVQSLMWRRWKIEESYAKDPEKFEVDYPTDERDCFIGGYGIIPRSELVKVEKKLREPMFVGDLIEENGVIKPIHRDGGPISIWEMPKPGVEYCGGLDSSEGLGGDKDFSAGVLKNRSSKRQVAQIHTNMIPPEAFAKVAYMLGMFYNRAWWCPERNNCGGELVRHLDYLGYTEIYTQKADRIDRITDSQQLGFYTTVLSKEHIVLQFCGRLRNGEIIPSSQAWFNEMTNFGRNDSGKLESLAGHDDLFIAGCLCEEMDKTLGEDQGFEHIDSNERSVDPLTGFIM